MSDHMQPSGATVKVFSSNSMQASLGELLPQFERAHHCKLSVEFDTAKLTMERINRGEVADLLIVNASTMDQLEALRKTVASSRRGLAVSTIGVAVLQGAPKPDIGTAATFKRALLNAKSMAYTSAGASGIYFADLIERLGIGEQVRGKARIQPGGLIGELVASGDAEMAIQQIPELRAVPGIQLVGPLPGEYQVRSLITGSLFAGARQAQKAQALLDFLGTPHAASVLKAKGYDLPGSGPT